MVRRFYRGNLRPVVLSVAFVAGLWSLFSGIGYLRNASVFSSQNTSLEIATIVFGSIYLLIAAIEAFGVFAAASQRLGPVRIFAFGSALVAILVIGLGLGQIVIHFTMKTAIINVCTTANEGSTFVYTGFWGPVYSDTLSGDDARSWCTDSWNHGSWSNIISFLATSVLAVMFTGVAFAYHRQLLDPTSAANASRAPSNQVRMGAFPSHYNRPYNTAVAPTLPYTTYPQYPAPAGPPPGHEDDDDSFVPPYEGKPPGYPGGGGGKWDYEAKDVKDPFADGDDAVERDVTTRPAFGG